MCLENCGLISIKGIGIFKISKHMQIKCSITSQIYNRIGTKTIIYNGAWEGNL